MRYAYIVTCTGVDKDPRTGEVLAVHCTYAPETRGGNAPDNRKVKATIHWVSVSHAVSVEARLYDYLFTADDPMAVPAGTDWIDTVNPLSLEVADNSWAEPGVKSAKSGDRFQFERLGYFCADPDSKPEKPVFNRTVSLKDSWSRIEKRGNAATP